RSSPDGITEIAALELDPNACADIRDRKEALLGGATKTERRQRPTRGNVSQHTRHRSLDAAQVIGIGVVRYLAAVFSVVAGFNSFHQPGEDCILIVHNRVYMPGIGSPPPPPPNCSLPSRSRAFRRASNFCV